MDLVFGVFWRDEKTGHVEIKNNTLIKNECYTDDLLKCACGRIKDYINMTGYLKARIMCSTINNKKSDLAYRKRPKYNFSFSIAKCRCGKP